MKNRYVIVVTGADGTVSVVGTRGGAAFTSERLAQIMARMIEPEGGDAMVHVIEMGP